MSHDTPDPPAAAAVARPVRPAAAYRPPPAPTDSTEPRTVTTSANPDQVRLVGENNHLRALLAAAEERLAGALRQAAELGPRLEQVQRDLAAVEPQMGALEEKTVRLQEAISRTGDQSHERHEAFLALCRVMWQGSGADFLRVARFLILETGLTEYSTMANLDHVIEDTVGILGYGLPEDQIEAVAPGLVAAFTERSNRAEKGASHD